MSSMFLFIFYSVKFSSGYVALYRASISGCLSRTPGSWLPRVSHPGIQFCGRPNNSILRPPGHIL
jgi:hypothetical protein